MDLKDKVSIITGSGRGIGKALAKKFAENSSIVVLVSRTNDEIVQTLKEIEDSHGQCISIQADVSKIDQIRSLVAQVLKKFSKIDILVNNAGIIKPIKPIHQVLPEEWVENIRINLFGTFYCIREVLPSMLSQNYGKIINLSGGGAFDPRPSFSAYSASKAAIVRLTETVAAEVKDSKISVNAIAPGAIKTKITYDTFESNDAGIEQIRAKDVIEKGGSDLEKVCNLALFLASDSSNGLTGKTLSAQWDDLEYIKNNISAIQNSDKYTMKRII